VNLIKYENGWAPHNLKTFYKVGGINYFNATTHTHKPKPKPQKPDVTRSLNAS
jgi:hypothetical protein